MSIHSIHQYQTEVEKIILYGGTKKETAIRNAFYYLLNEYAKGKGLMIVAEVTIKTPHGKNVTPDGTLKDSLRQDWGYWESKDESDKIDDEIKKKFDKDYPKENILFEDSKTAVLFQNGNEVMRVSFEDTEGLHKLLTSFISFQRPEVKHFRTAIELFKQDIPKVTETLRGIIIDAEKTNPTFIKASDVFLKLCHDSINPDVNQEDVREMIIQHILTEDIFNTIFGENQFHRENNIARELEGVIHTFFTGALRKMALAKVKPYYQAINAAASSIADHHEKQNFLKVIYETFYKSYNPKAADRLGVVYTPNEIVRFMVESTDYLLHKHFNKYLEDKNVEILDPATGTGTFICDLIDYIRKDKLEYKFKNEMHANEVAILPYYISNINIEFTYMQKMGKYSEFENLCFVDTLDNMGFTNRGRQIDMFIPFTEENSKRIKKQNDKKIAVIIGNPPYNANQANENDNNKNREYKEIDLRIKDTFIKLSTAQKTKVYDMYARFYRWAFDRLNDTTAGIIAFVTNRSFIDSKTFDGFRKTIQNDFDVAYIIDTKSDVRTNPKIAGTTHNIFGIQTGVAIMFLVKKLKPNKFPCEIHYMSMDDFWRKEQKLQWLAENQLKNISFEIIRPDKKNNWINLADNNDWENLLPLIDKKNSIFILNSNGINTAKDDWVYDLSIINLEKKCNYVIKQYETLLVNNNKNFPNVLKWSAGLKSNFVIGKRINYKKELIITSNYRPFFKLYYYSEKILSDRLTQNHYDIFGKTLLQKTPIISWNSNGLDIRTLATNQICDWHFTGDTNSFPLFTYNTEEKQIDNISQWGINRFTEFYKTKKIKRENVFHYIYAILHHPSYLKKYELNLKREFPRIPFYQDFFKWETWGKKLIDLHINYETVQPFLLKELITDTKENPRPKLKADKENGTISIDENLMLIDIPIEAWSYKLGNRSGLEWILDQYKEGKPKDPTIAEKFNAYKFADYKIQVIDLLKRVCTVSVETIKIIKQMEGLT